MLNDAQESRGRAADAARSLLPFSVAGQDRKLNRSHQEIIDTIAWINSDLAAILKAHSPLPAVFDKGVAGFRAQAEAIIK